VQWEGTSDNRAGGRLEETLQRILFALLASFLIVSASGVSALVLDEPCAIGDTDRDDSDGCLPTCATCGCCSQPVVPGAMAVDSTQQLEIAHEPLAINPLISLTARDVFHVPKSPSL
jgi:hypothetical protein